jgi:hypothetical protein
MPTNLCVNPSFEVDVSGCSFAGEFTRVGVDSFRGIVTTTGINFVAGDTLAVSYVGRSPDAVPMTIFVFWKDAALGGGGTISSPGQTDVLGVANTMYAYEFVAPALTQSFIFAFYDQTGGVAGEKFVLDNIVLEIPVTGYYTRIRSQFELRPY